YEDCCTIFTPKNPVTEPQFEKVLQYESGFDFEEMIDRAVGNIETIVIDKNYQTHQDEQNTWDDDLF
ncbi:tRNA 4-thiouridine(8) synthase ThiI, partial [Staphylococcus pseudintermedius]|nr:tRNA 4-thiouridine(8) synthase ThiI [Staphylococcus pseudintermedius]